MPRRWTICSLLAVGAVLAGCGGGSDVPVADDGSEVPVTGDGAAGTTTQPDTGSTTRGTTADAPSSGGVQPDGFTTVTARISGADGEVCEVCLWLADSTEERGRGLMGVTDLGDAAGMAFVFDEPGIGAFYMYRTPTPLSIAWFAPGGAVVGTAEMAPCLDTPAEDCPRFAPEEPYDLAIEVFSDGAGDPLAALGIGPGARVELVPGTEAERCVQAD